MDWNDKELAQEDYLKIVKILCYDIYQSKIAKFVLIVLLVIHGSITLIQTYYICYIFTVKQFISFGPIYFSMFYGIAEIVANLTYNDIIGNVFAEIPIWASHVAGPKIDLQIKKDVKIFTIFTLVNLILVFSSGCFYLQPLPHESEIFFFYYLLETQLTDPTIKMVLSAMYRLTWPLLTCVMSTHAIQMVYYAQHMKFQIRLAHEFIEKITEFEEERNWEELYYNRNYQKQIRERIIAVVQRHVELVRLGNIKLDVVAPLIGILVLCVILLGISVALFMISGHFYREYYLRQGVHCVALGMIFFGVFLCGQQFEDEVVQLPILINEINWYTFNQKNKKLYLIFLTKEMQPFELKLLQSYVLNYQLGLNIVKKIYAVISVMLNMKSQLFA